MSDRLRAALCGALLLICLRAAAQNDTTVNAIIQTRDGYLWLGTPHGLQRYDGSEFKIVGLGDAPVAALAEDSSGALGIGSESTGLYRMRNGEVTAVPGTGHEIYAIAQDRSRTMWVASEEGVVRFDEANAHPLETGPGAPRVAVRAIAAAGDDVWFGTAEGLVRYGDGNFMTMWSSSITALAAGRDGRLWIGSEHGGVDVFASGAFDKPPAAAPLALTTVLALAANRDGSMWISAEGKGVCRLAAGRLDCDPVDNAVRTIYEDREGTMWLGTTNNGLRHLPAGVFVTPVAEQTPRVTLRARDGTTWTGTSAGLTHNGHTWTVYDGLASTWVRALAEDPDGSIWIGTMGGLSRYAKGKITTIESDGDADVRALHVDRNGRLWIGTLTGLRCVENGRLVRCGEGRMRAAAIFAFDEAPGGTTEIAPLMDSPVFAMIRDDTGQLWLATAKGIFRGESLVVPMPSDGDVQPAAWRSDDGRLSFVTMRGIVAIDPKRAGTNDVPPPVVVESATLRNRDATFRYAALSFADPEKVQYRTMLEGFDRGWTDQGNSRVAQYIDLPPGRYVFRVVAANNAGVWNTRGASWPLRVEPPFWRTWWFAALFLAAIAGVAAIALLVRRENAKLEEMATVDPLTRLANRRSLDAAIGRMWSAHERRGESLAAILCDIDHFKTFNDTYGHQAGDVTLARVAQAIASALDPATDVVARYGGEEFIVVLPRAGTKEAAHVASIVLERVRALGIENRDGIVTLSAGAAAAIPDGVITAHDLIREADDALYRAKENGRNRVEVANVVRAAQAR